MIKTRQINQGTDQSGDGSVINTGDGSLCALFQNLKIAFKQLLSFNKYF